MYADDNWGEGGSLLHVHVGLNQIEPKNASIKH